MRSKEKILIVAGYPIHSGGGGGVIIRDLIRLMPKKNIFWFSSKKMKQNETTLLDSSTISLPKYRVIKRDFFQKILPFKIILEVLEHHLNIKRFFKIVNNYKPDIIWLILDEPEIPFLHAIMKNKNHFSSTLWHASVHDDPEAALNLLGKSISEGKKEQFGYILKNADSVDCICQGMKELYQNLYQIEPYVLTRSVKVNPSIKSVLSNRFKNNEINVVLGGWGDCPKPWPEVLIESIKFLRKTTNLDIRLYSFDPKTIPYNNKFILNCPRLNDLEYEKFLKKMHIGYAPDPLIKRGILFAKTSLSTKFVTYLGAGIPTLYHGPKDSSINNIFQIRKAGVIVSNNSVENLAKGFKELILNYESYRNNVELLAQTDFSEEKISKTLQSIFS